MIGSIDAFSIELVNAIPLALLPALPVLIIGFIRQSVLALLVRPAFSLHKFESDELSRAEIIYANICRRLKQQRDVGERVANLWGALLNRSKHSDENEELEAHAQYLRMTILRLRRRPLLRLKTWFHIKSSQFAFSQALVTYVVAFSLLIIAFHPSEQSAWADDEALRVSSVFIWHPIDKHLFYFNAIAAGFAALAALVFYLVRWLRLCRQYSLEFCVFKDLATTEPSELCDQFDAEEGTQDYPRLADPSVTFEDCNWNTILGLSGSASIAEIRKAYKELIKQNHPDRVNDMSPALMRLAESETKKINAAYQLALHSFALRV
jgi:DnaJ domain